MSDLSSREAAVAAVYEQKPDWTRDAIRALPAVQPQVAVKPLEWDDRRDSVWADHQFGWYEAFDTDSGIVLTQSGVEIGRFNLFSEAEAANQSGVEIGRFNLFSEAEAAAQADYDARTRAALVVHDHAALLRAAMDLPEVRALVSAAKRGLNYIQNSESEYGQVFECGNELRAAIAALEAKP